MGIIRSLAGDALAGGVDPLIDRGAAALGLCGFGSAGVGSIACAHEVGGGLIGDAGEASDELLPLRELGTASGIAAQAIGLDQGSRARFEMGDLRERGFSLGRFGERALAGNAAQAFEAVQALELDPVRAHAAISAASSATLRSIGTTSRWGWLRNWVSAPCMAMARSSCGSAPAR